MLQMNLSYRSKLSLCQFLLLFQRDELALLLCKHGFSTDDVEYHQGQPLAAALRESVLQASARQVGELIQELARTNGSMRTNISPRYRFDERWDDLRLCLELDGYKFAVREHELKDRFVPIEPMVEGAEPVEDDLVKELRISGLAKAEDILSVLDGSADAFRRGDHNGCLNNARVAIQTLATAIANARVATHPGSFDATKWGQVIAFLRTSSFITKQQEEGLAGVFSFVSPGSHTPIGFSEQEFARLGRAIVLSFCYFLAKHWNASNS
ncbi:MAG: hypothetical protein EOS75_31445 [Mesorhizobium sp.]|nr:MAG: hypothetical protein EOS75_31445 [Mesorhizobium sp.]